MPKLTQDAALELIRLAVLAPSGHNTQPWLFSVDSEAIRIYPDFSRRLPVVDPDDHALYISLGCALENLVIAARHHGFAPEVNLFPANEARECLLVRLLPGKPEPQPLFEAIPRRQSTRRAYDGRSVPAEDLRALEQAAQQPGIEFRLFTQQSEMEPIIEFVKEGNRRQFRDPAFVEELLSWIRFSRAEAEVRRDGLTASVMGLPNVPRWLGRFIMKTFAGPESEAKRVEKSIRSSAGLMLFIAERNDKRHWVNLGRSFERVALEAAARSIRHAHLNMPCEVVELRTQLRSHLRTAGEPLLLLRFGYAEPMPSSPRRPVEDALMGAEH